MPALEQRLDLEDPVIHIRLRLGQLFVVVGMRQTLARELRSGLRSQVVEPSALHGRRHNVAPEDASRVVGALARPEAVWGVKIQPAVVVDVEESATPGPAAMERSGRRGNVFESAVLGVLEEAIAREH